MSAVSKTGKLTPQEQEKYDTINASISLQRAEYDAWTKTLDPGYLESLKKRAEAMGLKLDVQTGRLSYGPNFSPLALPYQLCYIRHGKTEGNTEPRVFQGYVDYPNNQLNQLGRSQASDASNLLQKSFPDWKPHLILCSPLQRAIDTAAPIRNLFPEVPFETHEKLAEMAFGSLDNERVIDVSPSNMAHLFYLEQNAIVRAPEPHIVQKGWRDNRRKEGEVVPQECFVDVLERIKVYLEHLKLDPSYGSEPKVLFVGHSMTGAAASILMGHGRLVKDGHHLGFDGAYIMSHATPTFLPPQKP